VTPAVPRNATMTRSMRDAKNDTLRPPVPVQAEGDMLDLAAERIFNGRSKWAHSVRFWSAETEPCSMRQDDAFLSCILLVCEYPSGWPQAGTM
jgi:hypothetical protein